MDIVIHGEVNDVAEDQEDVTPVVDVHEIVSARLATPFARGDAVECQGNDVENELQRQPYGVHPLRTELKTKEKSHAFNYFNFLISIECNGI